MNKVISWASWWCLLLALTGCAVSGADIEQEKASGLAGELLDGHSYGQTFTPQSNGLYRIDLYTATYARTNTYPVIFRILTSPPSPASEASGGGAGAELVRLELPAEQISNSGPTVLTFPPLAGTAGRLLYFSVESPGAVPGDAVTLYRNDKDVYRGGQMYVDGQPASGDIAFIAYTQETFTPADVWNDFSTRASQDKPFFVFYGVLLGLVFAGLIAACGWPRRAAPAEEEPELDAEPAEKNHE